MIPILYESNTKIFNTNGIGRLSDAVSCTVTEERNGAFELQMQYPIEGNFYSEIRNSRVILVKPGDDQERQPFSIYKISKPINGIITVYAEHISYQLSFIPVAPFVADSVAAALDGFKQFAAEACPYTFWTDKTSSGEFKVSVPSSIRSCLGGVEGSILDVYGGEYEFDNFTVKLHANRGSDNGVTLRYGKNITDLQQEESIQNTITGIYPYWIDSEGTLVELPEKIISSEKAKNFPYPRTVPVDFSQKFQEKPTEKELREASEKYVADNDIGIPEVSIKVSFIPLGQTEEYEDISVLERVKLCDTISVYYEKLDVSAKAKIVKTVYNVLQEKYDSLEIGEARTNIADTIASQNSQMQELPTKGFLDAAVKNATNWITGVNGGYVVFHKNADGQPYEILIMDKPDIETAINVWRWNMNGWGYSKTGYNGTYNMAATIDGGFVADFITAGTMLANRIKGGTLTLGGTNNGNGSMKILDADGNEVGSWDKDGITATSGTLAGWKIEKGQIVKTIDLYDDMTATGLANVGDSDPVQYWVWVRNPTSATTATFFVGYKTKSNYLSGSSTVSPNFRVRSNGEFQANTGKIGRWSFGEKSFQGYTADGTSGFAFSYNSSEDIFYLYCDGYIEAGKLLQTEDMTVWGDLTVYGEKNRAVRIDENTAIKMSAYETASPYFGDIGFAEIGTDGTCTIEIEEIFSKTVSLEKYAVFLQTEGPGELYIKEKTAANFTVSGNPGTSFSYEIKAKQKGYENKRLEVAR